MSRILIVDDVLENRKLLASVIKENTDIEVLTAKSGQDVINQFDIIEKDPPDLILLDILMPKISGFHLAAILQAREQTKEVPIIFITALTDEDSKIKAFEAGGVDYISKPFHKQELIARINTHLRLKNLVDELKFKNKLLKEKEKQLKNNTDKKSGNLNNYSEPANTNESIHLHKNKQDYQVISKLSAFVAKKKGCKNELSEKIALYATLADLGESALPTNLLNKPGEFTTFERQIMEQHVLIGVNLNKDIDCVFTNLVLYHHERWDGKGYPQQLFKDNIPLEARILHVVDVFLALLSPRPYRAAHTLKQAYFLLEEGSGLDFDPSIVNIFIQEKENIKEILDKYF